MKKYRLLSILCMAMAVVCLLLLADPTEAQAETYGVFSYNVKNGKVYITACSETVSGAVVIPSSINGYPVTEISGAAFYECREMTSVSIPSTVTNIDYEAFYLCTGLTSITIPDSVTNIGYEAFYGCSGLTSVTIGTGVTTIKYSAFENCTNLTAIYFKAENVKSFGSDVFANAGQNGTGISVTIGSKVTKVPNKMLMDLTSVTKVTFENNNVCTSIGEYAFSGNSFKSVSLPNSVTSIGKSAFEYCKELTSITMPESLVSIGKWAFFYCEGLTSINIPATVNSIGDGAFSWCSSLEGVYISDINAWRKIDFISISANPLINCGKLYLNEQLVTQLVIPEGETTIGNYSFRGAECLTSVLLPESIEIIGDGAFCDCSGLTTIDIPEEVTSIGDRAFAGCTGLTAITIPEKVTNIDTYAFYNCQGLTKITFNAVNANDFINKNYVFYNAGQSGTGINLIIGAQVTKIPTYFLSPDSIDPYGSPNIVSIEFEQGSLCKSIGSYAFVDCHVPTSINIPSELISIGKCAFYRCEGLTSINIPATVNSIGDNAFYGCKGLTSVVIPEGVSGIGANTFGTCISLVSVSIPNSVTSIGESAFEWCTNLKSVTIPENVTSIGKRAFYNCVSLTEIRFNAVNMNDLSSNNLVFAYDFSSANINVIIGAKVTKIPAYLFYPYSTSASPKLSSVVFEEGSVCKTIGAYAFGKCIVLSAVTIPDSVTSVGRYAFYNCSGLKEIRFEGSAPTMGYYCFYGVTATAYYPADDTTWTRNVRQNYGGTITWVPYGNLVTVCNGAESVGYETMEQALINYETGYLRLNADLQSKIVLTKDLYIDLNGFDLSGTVVTNGYKIYGMDSTTDSYSCEAIGYMNLVDENGNEIVPEAYFMSDITGSSKRYMAIKDENGYSFHRFFLCVTHMSLKPSSTGVGYKAVFYGDDMVAAALNSFGFTMQLEGNDPITVKMSGDKFVSGKVITLRIDNYDVEHFGETGLSAKVMLQLTDGTVIESGAATMTFRGLMEQLNTASDAFTADQLAAIAAMIEKHAIIKRWDTENLY